jgi:hypothetical protein
LGPEWASAKIVQALRPLFQAQTQLPPAFAEVSLVVRVFQWREARID